MQPIASDVITGPFYGTFLEHWPRAVASLSMPHVGYVLQPDEARMLASLGEVERFGQNLSYSMALTEFLLGALARFEDGLFLRLGGRSFVTNDRGPRQVRSLAGALQILERPGYRAARMAHRCRLANRPVWLFARQWVSMAPSEEFRMFIRNRKLIGACQYHHALAFPELADRARTVCASIEAFASQLAALSHLPNVVADIFVPHSSKNPPLLIELNPFMNVTGRALFVQGDHRAFDKTFRFRTPDGAIRGIALVCG